MKNVVGRASPFPDTADNVQVATGTTPHDVIRPTKLAPRTTCAPLPASSEAAQGCRGHARNRFRYRSAPVRHDDLATCLHPRQRPQGTPPSEHVDPPIAIRHHRLGRQSGRSRALGPTAAWCSSRRRHGQGKLELRYGKLAPVKRASVRCPANVCCPLSGFVVDGPRVRERACEASDLAHRVHRVARPRLTGDGHAQSLGEAAG